MPLFQEALTLRSWLLPDYPDVYLMCFLPAALTSDYLVSTAIFYKRMVIMLMT